MARHVIVYDNWSSGPGEFGRLGPVHAPKNSFSGTNVLLNKSGQLCVRPGIKNMNPASLGSGAIVGLGERSTAANIWFVQTDRVRQMTIATPTVSTLTTAMTSAPGNVDGHVSSSGLELIGTNNSGSYNIASGTVTPLTGSPNATTIAIYGERIVSTSGNALRYSAAADVNSWPVGNTITVGDTSAITSLFVQRDHLLIMKASGQQFVLTGVPGVNDTLRQTSNYVGPADVLDATIDRTDVVWFRPTDSLFPAQTNGSTRNAWPNLNYVSGLGVSGVKTFLLPDLSELMVWDTSEIALLRQKGVWTKHQFGVSLARAAAVGTCVFRRDPGDSATADLGNVIVLHDGSATPVIWGWSPDLGRPGSETAVSGAAPERAGDNSTTAVAGSVEFPEQRAEDWTELQATRVIVDFTSWQCAGASTSHFDLVVRSTRQLGGTYTDSIVSSFDLADALSSTSGTNRRVEFAVGDQGRGGGVQVFLTNMRGVAITRVAVRCESYPAQ